MRVAPLSIIDTKRKWRRYFDILNHAFDETTDLSLVTRQLRG